MTFSIRERLFLGMATTLVAMLGVTSLVIYVAARTALQREFEARVQAESRALAESVHYEANEVEQESLSTSYKLTATMRGVIEMTTTAGKVIARSPGLDGSLPFSTQCTRIELAPGEQWVALSTRFHPAVELSQDLQHEDEEEEREHHRLRRINGPFAVNFGHHANSYQDALLPASIVQRQEDIPQELILTVALDGSSTERALDRLVLIIFTTATSALVLGLGALLIIVRQACLPLTTLAGRIGGIVRRDSPTIEHLPTAQAPAELAPLIDGINQLLSQLQQTIERERSFSADIAHELRTPLTGLRASIDVCLRREREPEAYRQTLEESRRQCIQLQSMVGTLLELARLDTASPGVGEAAIMRSEIPLGPMILHVWQEFAARAEERQIRLVCAYDSLMVAADAERFERILVNLIENAVNYCDQGGTISITAEVGGGRVRIRVANSGSRIAAADANKVFDRFWRGDRARSGAGVHAGLGLCLCQRLVRLMAGSISATSTPGGEFVIAIELPGRRASQESGLVPALSR